MEYLKKYKWYIISYVLYVSIFMSIFMSTATQHEMKTDFWPSFLFFCIAIPLVLYILKTLYASHKEKKRAAAQQADSWSLTDFAKLHGRMQVNIFTDNLGNDVLDSCRFISSDGIETLVCISQLLKSKSKQWLTDNKDCLIVKVMESGKYCLCKAWEDVDLGIK